MDALKRIMKKINMTSQNSTISKYNCDICKDTGWIESIERAYRQCKCVDKERLKKMWELYNLNADNVKKLNEYETYDALTEKAKNKAIKYINTFNIKEKNNWMAMMGQPGSGKSHIVIAVGAALLNKGYKVVYMPYTEVLKELKGYANNIEDYSKLIKRYLNTEILVIDDLFKDKVKNNKLIGELTETDIKHIYPILNSRYNNNLTTIISTECIPEMLMSLDEALGGRILEKSTNNSMIFKGSQYNYRVKQFTKKCN